MPIYDNTYRRIEGIRPAGRFRFLPICRAGIVLFFRKKLYILGALLAFIPFFLMMFGLAAPHLLPFPVEELGSDLVRFLHLHPSTLFVYLTKFEWIFIFLFTILAGGGLVANDLRANALEIYFSRPITVLDYFLGKLGVVLTVLLGLTLVPALLLWVIDILLAEEVGFWKGHLHLIPRIAAACLFVTVPYALMILAASAAAKSARNAMLLFAGVERVLTLSGAILTRALQRDEWGLLSVTKSMDRMTFWALGADRGDVEMLWQGRDPIPLINLPLWMPASVIAFVCVGCAFIVLRRVRGVEIVKG